jgi:cysteinyl-tRNA synthetase
MLQSHYRSQINFTWEALEAAQHFLLALYNWAELSHQPSVNLLSNDVIEDIQTAVFDDLGTPQALALVARLSLERPSSKLLAKLDQLFGLNLTKRGDITAEQKRWIADREAARNQKDFAESDRIRAELEKQGIMLDDAPGGTIWRRAAI